MSAADPTDFASALVTGRALILLQLVSRLLTFALNQGLVRLAPPEVLGTAAIQFDLVASTVLFLSREGIRNALLRTASDQNKPILSQHDASLAALPLRFGLGISTAAVGIYLGTSSAATISQPYFHLSLALYVLAALLELAIEPLYIRALRESPPRIRVRVQAEGGMAIVRALVSFSSLVLDRSGKHALLGFAMGQVAGAAWLAGRYTFEYGDVAAVIWPPTSDAAKFDPVTFSLAMANTRQSLVKHVLTEADRIAVGRISPLGDQGGYAIAMNYGSLVARIIFQPLEETLLLHFSRTLGSASTLPLLTFSLHISAHLALLLPVFLPPLLPLILPLLLPHRYTVETSAATTLQTYLMWYLPLLSLNGILEAFHASSATPAQVSRQARWMVASSGAFAACLYVFTRLITDVGITTEQALIYASCASMLIRIWYAFAHARMFFKAEEASLSLGAVVPKCSVLVAVVVNGAALWIASNKLGLGGWKDQATLLGCGGAAGAVLLVTIYLVEKDDFRALGRSLRVE